MSFNSAQDSIFQRDLPDLNIVKGDTLEDVVQKMYNQYYKPDDIQFIIDSTVGDPAAGTNIYNNTFLANKRFRVINRPDYLSKDEIQTDAVYTHALWQIKDWLGKLPDSLVFLAPTSPYRNHIHIDEAINLYNKNSDGITVISAFKDYRFHWDGNIPVKHNPMRRRGIQYVPKEDWLYQENGAIYVVNALNFSMETSYRFPPYQIYEMSQESSVDVDTLIDWDLAESLIKIS